MKRPTAKRLPNSPSRSSTTGSTLNQTAPFARTDPAPDLEDKGNFIVHAGARTYINGEQKNFFDRYSDYIYLGLFLGSGGRIGVDRRAALGAYPATAQPHAAGDAAAGSARRSAQATTQADVDEVERQAQEVFRSALERGRGRRS